MRLDIRGSSVGQFELQLDGIPNVAYLKNVEGGLLKANTIEESVGTHLEFMKHLSTVELEPMTFELGMTDSGHILKWIQDSWSRRPSRKNGFVKHADFDYKESLSVHFYEALVSEVTFPGLDAAGKEAAFLKVKIQPEKIEMNRGSQSPIVAQSINWGRQKHWNVSCFRLNLERFRDLHVAKIDSFTVKQGMKALYTGNGRLPEWEPTKLTFPDLSVHMSLVHAGPIIDWYKRAIMDGATDPSFETTGSIEFLSPDKNETVFEVKLDQVGIKSLTIDKSEKQDQLKRVKFDLYVAKMDID